VQQGSACFKESGSLDYGFPVAGPFSFRDTWAESRSGGRIHRAVDIFAPEGSEVYAITTGVVDTLATLGEAGITLFLRGQDGKGYGYMHLQGYAAGLVEGKVVRTGELLGYVGRTGIQTSAAHLHFQVYADHRLCKDELLNPYGFLVQLCHGIGVTDLYQPKMARLEDPERRVSAIKVYRRPNFAAQRGRVGQFSVKDSSVVVINNF
jgi:murein DD-endopeptidase MepM/ murein hydrolase activator NlpD